jgi:PAS domain S-box-containing protein
MASIHLGAGDEIEELRVRLQEAEDTLSAIRSGEVDALIINGPDGEQVFTLKGADHAYRVIVEQMAEAALTLSLDGTVLYCNSRFSTLLKRPLDTVIGSAIAKFLSVESEALFRSLIAEGCKGRSEVVLQASDGTTVPAYMSCNRVMIENCQAVCVIVTDLTEQKRREALLVVERRQAEERIRANDRLAAMGMTAAALAHEIANPLQWIFTTVQLMQHELEQEKEIDRSWSSQLSDVHQELARLSSLLHDFRSLARPMQLNVAPLHFSDFIAEVEKLVSPETEKSGIRVEHDIAGGLPALNVDGEKIKQVVLNLYKNSIEAMPSGGTLTAKAYTEEGERVVIEIADTGSGIPEGFDIFEPFVTTKDKGTGLGLMVVRQILAAHEGSISYSSKAGQGTTFRIVLPVTTSTQAATS